MEADRMLRLIQGVHPDTVSRLRLRPISSGKIQFSLILVGQIKRSLLFLFNHHLKLFRYILIVQYGKFKISYLLSLFLPGDTAGQKTYGQAETHAE